MTWRALRRTVPMSKSLAKPSDFAARFYFHALSQTDAWGVLDGVEAESREELAAKARALCVPRLPATDADVEGAIDELVAAGRLELYNVGGRWYIAVTAFDENQPRELLRRRGLPRVPLPPSRTSPGGVGSTSAPKTETETEKETEEGSPTAVARPAATLPSAITRDELIASVAAQLSDADENTPRVLTSVAKGLPEAAFHTALESLSERRSRSPQLASEARYLAATLKRMKSEGQYPKTRGD